MSIAKSQQLVWLMTNGDYAKSSFIPHVQLPQKRRSHKLMAEVSLAAEKEHVKMIEKFNKTINHSYSANGMELQKEEVKDIFKRSLGKHIKSLKN